MTNVAGVARRQGRPRRQTRPPRTPEADFQTRVTALAELRGWQWMHVKPGLFADGRFATMTSGTMARGWPDLVMVQPRTGRLLFVELKVPPNQVTTDQSATLDLLRSVPFAEVYVWRPEDWHVAERVLK